MYLCFHCKESLFLLAIMQNMVNRLVTKIFFKWGESRKKGRLGRSPNGDFGPQIEGPENLEDTMQRLVQREFNKIKGGDYTHILCMFGQTNNIV